MKKYGRFGRTTIDIYNHSRKTKYGEVDCFRRILLTDQKNLLYDERKLFSWMYLKMSNVYVMKMVMKSP